MTKYLKYVWLGIGAILAGVIFITVIALLLQRNPPVVQEPAWDSPQTRDLAVRACYDCHSNQTQWPLYDKLPFSSWLAVADTLRGRRHLNFSEWGTSPVGGERGRGVNDVIEVIREGSMPPRLYVMLHPKANLTDQEKQQLIQGLQASLK